MLPTSDNFGKALTQTEEKALLASCLQSRSPSLYTVVVLALNSGMRHGEIRLLQWKQIDFANRSLIVGKSKTQNGSGRTIPLNSRLLAVLEMWAAHFPARNPEDYVFPAERYGAGTDNFKACTYGTDATKPINDWKEAWEGAKQRAGAILIPMSLDEASNQKPQAQSAAFTTFATPPVLGCLKRVCRTRWLQRSWLERCHYDPNGQAVRAHWPASDARRSGSTWTRKIRGVPQVLPKGREFG
jgi:Phage integrase family